MNKKDWKAGEAKLITSRARIMVANVTAEGTEALTARWVITTGVSEAVGANGNSTTENCAS